MSITFYTCECHTWLMCVSVILANEQHILLVDAWPHNGMHGLWLYLSCRPANSICYSWPNSQVLLSDGVHGCMCSAKKASSQLVCYSAFVWPIPAQAYGHEWCEASIGKLSEVLCAVLCCITVLLYCVYSKVPSNILAAARPCHAMPCHLCNVWII